MDGEENFVDLDTLEIPPEVIACVHQELAHGYRVIPISREGSTVTIATVDALDTDMLSELGQLLGCTVVATLAGSDAIDRALARYYGLADVSIPSSLGPEDLLDDTRAPREEDNLEVLRTLNRLLTQAVTVHADKVIIEAVLSGGHWRVVSAHPSTVASGDIAHIRARALIDRLKVMAELHLEECTKPQDGHFELTLDNRMVDARVTTVPVLDGEIAVLRITYPPA